MDIPTHCDIQQRMQLILRIKKEEKWEGPRVDSSVSQDVPLAHKVVQSQTSLSGEGHYWLTKHRVLCRGQPISSVPGQIVNTGSEDHKVTAPIFPWRGKSPG